MNIIVINILLVGVEMLQRFFQPRFGRYDGVILEVVYESTTSLVLNPLVQLSVILSQCLNTWGEMLRGLHMKWASLI